MEMVSLRDVRRLRRRKPEGDTAEPTDLADGRADYDITPEVAEQRRRARERVEEEQREWDYVDALIREASWFSWEVDRLVLRMALGVAAPEEVRRLRDRYDAITDKTYAAAYWGELEAACAAGGVDPNTGERLAAEC
jgi:hypothetical protein